MFKRFRSAVYFLGLAWVASLVTTAVSAAVNQTWTLTTAPVAEWSCVCMTPDGNGLMAGNLGGPQGGTICSSGDFGNSWGSDLPGVPPHETNGGAYWAWSAVAREVDDGTPFAAGSGGPIYFWPIDTGPPPPSWWLETSAPSTTWSAMVCDYDGSVVAAAVGVYQAGGIYISADEGFSWNQSDAPDQFWSALATTPDGSRVVGTVVNGGIYIATDQGFGWNQTKAPNEPWTSVAASSDGIFLAATSSSGGIYGSRDAGATWTLLRAPSLNWTSIASSADGTHLAAAAYNGTIYTSTNTGATWQASQAPVQNWSAIASSADGTKLVAVVANGGIYTYDSQTVAPPPAPPLLSLSVSGSRGTLSWQSMTAFQLQSSTNLSSTNWADVSTPPTSANSQNQVLVLLPNGQIFYRLKSL